MTEERLLTLIHNGELDDYVETLGLRIKRLEYMSENYAQLMDTIEASLEYDYNLVQTWGIHILRDYMRKHFDHVWEWPVTQWDLDNIKARLARSILVDGIRIKDIIVLNGRGVRFEGAYHHLTDVNEDTYFRIHGYRQVAIALQISIEPFVKYVAVNMFPRWHQYVYLMSMDGRKLSNTVLNAGLILIPVPEPGDYFLVVGELFDRESILMISDIIGLGEYRESESLVLTWKPRGFFNYLFAYPVLSGHTDLFLTDGSNTVDVSYGINPVQEWMIQKQESHLSTTVDYLGTTYNLAFLVSSVSPVISKKAGSGGLIYYFPTKTTISGRGTLWQLDRSWRFTKEITIDGDVSLVGLYKSDGRDYKMDGIVLEYEEPIYFLDRDYFYIRNSAGNIYLVFRRNPVELATGDTIYWYDLKDMQLRVNADHGGVVFFGANNLLLPLGPTQMPKYVEIGDYDRMTEGTSPMEGEHSET